MKFLVTVLVLALMELAASEGTEKDKGANEETYDYRQYPVTQYQRYLPRSYVPDTKYQTYGADPAYVYPASYDAHRLHLSGGIYRPYGYDDVYAYNTGYKPYVYDNTYKHYDRSVYRYAKHPYIHYAPGIY